MWPSANWTHSQRSCTCYKVIPWGNRNSFPFVQNYWTMYVLSRGYELHVQAIYTTIWWNLNVVTWFGCPMWSLLLKIRRISLILLRSEYLVRLGRRWYLKVFTLLPLIPWVQKHHYILILSLSPAGHNKFPANLHLNVTSFQPQYSPLILFPCQTFGTHFSFLYLTHNNLQRKNFFSQLTIVDLVQCNFIFSLSLQYNSPGTSGYELITFHHAILLFTLQFHYYPKFLIHTFDMANLATKPSPRDDGLVDRLDF